MDRTFALWIVVVAAIVGITIWVGTMYSPTGNVVLEGSEVVEVLSVNNCVVEVDADWNTCCFNECDDFCSALDLVQTFHHANRHQCGCWCDKA